DQAHRSFAEGRSDTDSRSRRAPEARRPDGRAEQTGHRRPGRRGPRGVARPENRSGPSSERLRHRGRGAEGPPGAGLREAASPVDLWLRTPLMTVSRSERPLIVQGDHTVLLEVDHPMHAEARDALAQIAELEKSPEHVHTYRITPLSLWNAAGAGATADDVLQSLDA